MTDLAPGLQIKGGQAVPGKAAVEFQRIYKTHFSSTCRLLRKWGVAAKDVEDAVQDVFMVVHRKLPDCDTTRPMEPWIAAIAYRVASDWRKKAFNRQDLVGSGSEVEVRDPRPDAEQVAHQQQLRAHVMLALDSLDEDRRAVFVLHDMEGYPIPELAVSMGVPLNTLYSRLRLARQQFALTLRQVRQEGAAS